ncbi:oligopeptide/dipeptide ABC transporter ATP-binding protein [Streptosporangium becharense]|uniref:Oligopeptide/dipeptide ABC transporter ATP-binding protein n=1 Tax=Streptosporangium becharense TaxID=1816182 RepID=A0A7W9ME91_9ACTN|nr:ABC transporter ATP-binding protein [Streptosporangium becharense]MBB2914052.1 oligopeptide/dipeptide ABC transporter ATP-binding protein [Streptosporangium becharense]MBB5817079.1 oligopeptide/dipeptide ABC transporter ATP-binding protein [Streptosporangium becharense]
MSTAHETAAGLPESSVPLLVASGLRFRVGDAVAIGPIDLAVSAGQSLGIVGETGSGKSLLCRTLVGMLDGVGGAIDSGSLVIGGTELAGASSRAWVDLRRSVIGFVPQASLSGLNPVRRVSAHLDETLRVQGVDDRAARRARSLELLREVRMRDPERVLRSYGHELSGGMRQRVMLALALAGDPRILVADEPTTALDATVQREVLNLVKDVQRERNMAVVTVSHDMRVVRRTCDFVAVMYAGRVIEAGPADQVLSRPSHPYTRALLAADPALVPRGAPLSAIPGSPRQPHAWRDGTCSFMERCAFSTDICGQAEPDLEQRLGDQSVACHHAQEVARA